MPKKVYFSRIGQFKYQKHTLVLLLALIFTILFHSELALADHIGPEKIVDGKYVVILSLVPEENATGTMRLRFLFRDMQTGKPLLAPVSYNAKIIDDKQQIVFENHSMKAVNGLGEFTYQFPKNGLYKVFLEFEKADEPDKTYKVDSWPIWVPGQKREFFYPLGMSELAGFALLILALVIVFVNYLLIKRKSKKKKH